MDMATKEDISGFIAQIWQWVADTIDSSNCQLDLSDADALIGIVKIAMALFNSRDATTIMTTSSPQLQTFRQKFLIFKMSFQTSALVSSLLAVVNRIKTKLMPAFHHKEGDLRSLLIEVSVISTNTVL